jgi:uncharacterized protein
MGLNQRDTETLKSIFVKYPSVKEVLIFGSRAKGNFTSGSDIDLAIMNKGVTKDTLMKLKADFEESSLPYFVEVVYYPAIEHTDLKEHIDRVGIALYVSSH